MKQTKKYCGAMESKGGVLVISILAVLVLFALFTATSKKGTFGTPAGHKVEWEDIQEQQNANPRNITIKNGQKLVVF